MNCESMNCKENSRQLLNQTDAKHNYNRDLCTHVFLLFGQFICCFEFLLAPWVTLVYNTHLKCAIKNREYSKF